MSPPLIPAAYDVRALSLAEAARSDVVMIAVPVAEMGDCHQEHRATGQTRRDDTRHCFGQMLPAMAHEISAGKRPYRADAPIIRSAKRGARWPGGTATGVARRVVNSILRGCSAGRRTRPRVQLRPADEHDREMAMCRRSPTLWAARFHPCIPRRDVEDAELPTSARSVRFAENATASSCSPRSRH